jgi:hypothetical protein
MTQLELNQGSHITENINFRINLVKLLKQQIARKTNSEHRVGSDFQRYHIILLKCPVFNKSAKACKK